MTRKPKGHIIAAWAESAAGPGWANSPVWFLYQHPDRTLEVRCLQPDEQSPEIGILYGISQATHGAMTQAVRKAVKEE